MDPQQILTRLRDDDDRWDGVEYRSPGGAPQPHPAQWRRVTIAVVAGLAVGAVAAVTIVGLRGSQGFAPSVSTSSPAAESTQATSPAPEPSSTPTPTATPTIMWEVAGADLPGSEVVTMLSEPRTQEFTGTSKVDLGRRPAGSTGVSYVLTCQSPGSFSFPDGSGETCGDVDLNRAQTTPLAANVYSIKAGVETLTITATAGASWTLITRWVESHLSPLGVNASGQTYGTAATGLHPTLIATDASNGRVGYSYAKDHHGYDSGCSMADPAKYAECQEAFAKTIPPIKVYLSDGKTLIGEMRTSGGTHVEYAVTPTPTPTP